jgi:hypothetical protein
VRISAQTRLDVDLSVGDEIRSGTWWYDEQETGLLPSRAWGAGFVATGCDLSVTSQSPAVLRALAAAVAAAADELEARYAEHGVQPPAVEQ